ncbi:MAG: 4-hydroxythreonine-4-phosphate dehydrogenase PdxA [Candidatus Lindowbacteria bacterium]|nr:4-hydroxythreonine-4-phosphate dehydrogenase PdxA [Candidatus Lindowbacteria bacterium]
MTRPIIGITMGDPAGVGPEIIYKALRQPRVQSSCYPLIFGTSRFLTGLSLSAAIRSNFEIVQSPAEALFKYGKIDVVEIEASPAIRVGEKSAASGRAALDYLERATQAALRGEIDALVTAPVSKAAIRMAGARDFIGHTEYLAKTAGVTSFAMTFWSSRLKVALVTTHIPLREVASTINSKQILSVSILANEALKKLGFPKPRIGVAGLNPHAGEDSAFGDEDARIVAPAVRAARKRRIDARGPLPADSLFHAALHGAYDLVVAMYHDQALAPFKLIAFDEGVNFTLGLPFVRTSVDHGTAYDIAGKGIASERSLVQAIKLAVRLAQ